MEFNKIISLVLGFIVLILVFLWISNRVKSSQTTTTTNSKVTVTMTRTPTPTGTTQEQGSTWNPFSFLFQKDTSPTPTPTLQKQGEATYVSGTPTITPVQIRVVEISTQQTNDKPTISKGPIIYTNSTTGTIAQIPETGVGALFLPLSLAAMSAGMYLRKRS